jgi:hypothetical protein
MKQEKPNDVKVVTKLQSRATNKHSSVRMNMTSEDESICDTVRTGLMYGADTHQGLS